MAVKNFLKWPDKRLRSRADEITEITQDIISIWDDMVDTMNAMPGIGLAAPQIGFNLRLAVIDASEARNKPVKLANPEILQSSLEYSELEEEIVIKLALASGFVRLRNENVRDDLFSGVSDASWL